MYSQRDSNVETSVLLQTRRRGSIRGSRRRRSGSGSEIRPRRRSVGSGTSATNVQILHRSNSTK